MPPTVAADEFLNNIKLFEFPYDAALLVKVKSFTADKSPVEVSVVNAPVEAVVAPIDILLIVPTPVDVRANVGVLLAVRVIRLV